MKQPIILAALMLLPASILLAQRNSPASQTASGTFSLGTRNTFSFFDEDVAMGKGIGGQFRIQVNNRLNTEWFADFITSTNKTYTYRNDYHIGWSLMYYPGKTTDFSKLFQPYILAGHCFDYSKVSQQGNKDNYADRLSMAAQAGLGTHINITPKFDCSLSAQYMLHFGKGIETTIDKDAVIIERADHTHIDGHVLISLSFNYKLFRLWRSKG